MALDRVVWIKITRRNTPTPMTDTLISRAQLLEAKMNYPQQKGEDPTYEESATSQQILPSLSQCLMGPLHSYKY